MKHSKRKAELNIQMEIRSGLRARCSVLGARDQRGWLGYIYISALDALMASARGQERQGA